MTAQKPLPFLLENLIRIVYANIIQFLCQSKMTGLAQSEGFLKFEKLETFNINHLRLICTSLFHVIRSNVSSMFHPFNRCTESQIK